MTQQRIETLYKRIREYHQKHGLTDVNLMEDIKLKCSQQLGRGRNEVVNSDKSYVSENESKVKELSKKIMENKLKCAQQRQRIEELTVIFS